MLINASLKKEFNHGLKTTFYFMLLGTLVLTELSKGLKSLFRTRALLSLTSAHLVPHSQSRDILMNESVGALGAGTLRIRMSPTAMLCEAELC